MSGATDPATIPKDLRVRPAVLDDVPAVVDFQLRMAQETEGLELHRPTVTRGVEAVFADPSKGVYWVATEAPDRDTQPPVASLLVTTEWSDWRNGTVWWIQSVYVVPAFRGRGVFSRMYRELRHQVESRSDLHGLRLYVDRRNRAAQEVYEHLDMQRDHYELFEWLK